MTSVSNRTDPTNRLRLHSPVTRPSPSSSNGSSLSSPPAKRPAREKRQQTQPQTPALPLIAAPSERISLGQLCEFASQRVYTDLINMSEVYALKFE